MDECASDHSYVNQGQVMRANHWSLTEIHRFCLTLNRLILI